MVSKVMGMEQQEVALQPGVAICHVENYTEKDGLQREKQKEEERRVHVSPLVPDLPCPVPAAHPAL